MSENEVTESCVMIQQLFEQYKNDKYMTSRIHQYICNRLPKIFESLQKTHLTNQTYEEQMQTQQDSFMQTFLHMNNYFYVPATEKFFVYMNNHYNIISEDHILHNVLTNISKNKQLLSWKKSTKIHVMCKIKSNLLTKSIPNSETIQHVLDLLYPTFFSTKTETKYFLTILGDAIFKKNSNIFHFITSKSKSFLQEINNYSQIYIGSNIINTFKHKYYDHEYMNCRLIKISENIKNENIWKPFISQYFLDFICVASHYSIRYNSSDEYILSSSNDSLIQYTCYLKEKTQENIVDIFLKEYITFIPPDIQSTQNISTSQNMQGTQIPWKNMLYLWKHFLDKNQLPFVVFQQNLKQILIQKLSSCYNESNDCFNGICSKYMPTIQTFLQFWNDTMQLCDSEYDLEIEEIMLLFKEWVISQNILLNHINESQLIDLITYYYPNVEIEDNKYIHKIICNRWNKKEHIKSALEKLRNEIIASNGSFSNISFYEAYEYYCKKQKTENMKSLIVSKQYFEKYIFENLTNYIIDDAFISADWLFLD
jgi:hypothetical protein